MTDGSTVLAVLRLLVSLGVVIALVVVLARWARKRGVGGSRGARPDLQVDVIARRGLGRGSAVHVVQVGQQVLVLGVTDQHVSLLRELDPLPAPVPTADPGAGDGGSAPADFDRVLAATAAAAPADGGTVADGDTVPAGPGGLTLVGMTRAERRAQERGRTRHLPGLAALTARPTTSGTTPTGMPAAPTATPSGAQVPTGWPWSAATVVLGVLRGKSA